MLVRLALMVVLQAPPVIRVILEFPVRLGRLVLPAHLEIPGQLVRLVRKACRTFLAQPATLALPV